MDYHDGQDFHRQAHEVITSKHWKIYLEFARCMRYQAIQQRSKNKISARVLAS